jgi:hypothetical protein
MYNHLPKFIPVDKRLSQQQQGAAYLRQAYAGQRALRELQGRIDESEWRGLFRVMAKAIRLGRAKLKRLLQRFVRSVDNHRPAYSPISDDDQDWRVAAGLSSGPPPPPQKRRRRPWLEPRAPESEKINRSAQADLIPARKNNQTEIFGTGSRAPNARITRAQHRSGGRPCA